MFLLMEYDKDDKKFKIKYDSRFRVFYIIVYGFGLHLGFNTMNKIIDDICRRAIEEFKNDQLGG